MKKLCLVLAATVLCVWVQNTVAGPREDEFLKKLQAELHKRGDPWIAGKTSVSDLPIEVKRKMLMLGLVPSMGETPKSQIRLSSEPLQQPPDSFDWRNKDGHNWMTGVRDQGGYGSCWAFGSVAMLEARWNIWNNMPENDLDLSEQFVVSCNPYGYGNGGWIDFWPWVMDTTNGLPDEACYPYIAQDGNCNDRCSDWEERAAPYDISEWGELANNDPNLATLMKEEIMNGPVATTMTPKEDFFYYKGGVYTPIMGDDIFIDGAPKVTHAVCLAGWNNSKNKWLFKNSWGAGWGDNGYGWLVYGNEGSSGMGPYKNTWVTPKAGYKIILESVQMTEPNDGVWDPGEQVSFVTTLKAKGLSFTNVQGTLTETDPNVTVDMGSFNFGNIPVDSTANNTSNPYKATASASHPGGTVTFNLHVTAPESSYASDLTFNADIGWIACEQIDNFANPCYFPYAMAFDGTYLWLTGRAGTQNAIRKLNMSGSQVGTIPAPENDTMCTGIAWDAANSRLWVQSCSKKKIYKVNPSNGTVETSFVSPATSYPTGLAYDGEYLYAVDRDQKKIFKLTTSGSVVTSFNITFSGNYGPRALSFHPHPSAPDQGSLILYITHGTGNVVDSTCIYEIKRSDGSWTGKKCTTPGNTGANGRLVCVDPYRGLYWVDGGQNGPISRIKGFYAGLGVEEDILTPRINDLTILPNPSRHETSISFYVPEAKKVSINIYDIAGKLVYRLADDVFQAGNHKVTWNGTDFSGKNKASGVYFCRVEASDFTTAKKFIILQ